MEPSSFSEIEKTRFLAANFSRLQGLRAVPIGLLAFLISLWANVQTGPATNFIFPIIIGLFCLVLLTLIDRYYRRTFGVAKTSAQIRRTDWIMSVIGVITALAAVWLDNSTHLPFSLVGLVLAAAFLGDYFIMVHYSHYWYTPITLLAALIIAITSILPVLVMDEWWHQIGIKAETLGVFMVTGIVFMISGFISHFYFIRALPKEAHRDQPI